MELSPRSRRTDLEAAIAASTPGGGGGVATPTASAAPAELPGDALAPRGCSISFDAVSLAIPLPKARGGDGPAERLLLSGITGLVPPSTLYAVMGSSGAGKTTLLDVASRRRNQGRLTGDVMFDGCLVSLPALKKLTAYVQQDDALFAWCSIEETLQFAACMKLRDASLEDRREAVETALTQMSLQLARRTFVGNRLVRGCSGGERKRTSVAAGLLGGPRALFLDEPTSGLDSATAAGVMASLRDLRKQGCTLLCTIHQPSPSIWGMFDGLLLLHRGRLCYFGQGGEAPCHFLEAQGFQYRAGWNVADWVLDTISSGLDGFGEAGSTGAVPPEQRHDFAAAYDQSQLCAAQAAAVAAERKGLPGMSVSSSELYANSALREVALLVRWRGVARYATGLFAFSRIVLFASLGALFASFFYQQRLDLPGIAALNSIIFLTVSTPTYLGSVFVQDLISEREVYTREFHDSYYRVSSYVVAKVLSDIPPAVVAALVYTGILYPAVKLRMDAEALLFFALCTFVNLMIAMLVGFTLSSVLPGEVAPMVLLPCYATLNTLVTGFLLTRATIPVIWRWLYTLSYEQWLWSALMVNQFEGQSFDRLCQGHNTTLQAVTAVFPGGVNATAAQLGLLSMLVHDTSCRPIQGTTLLAAFSLESRSKWSSLGYSALTFPCLCAAFYTGVRCVKHERR